MCKFDWNTFSNVLQGIGAIASAVIAWYVFIQGKRIKTLTEVVSELKDSNSKMEASNTILRKRFETERLITLKDRMPLIVKNGEYDTPEHYRIRIQIKNIGINAINIKVADFNKVGPYTVTFRDERLDTNANSEIEIHFITQESFYSDHVDFNISYVSYYGIEHKQRIYMDEQRHFHIQLPDDYINV